MADIVPRCANYAGTYKCRAGVDVTAVRDDELRVPCLSIGGVHGAAACDEFVPIAEPPASTGPMSQALEALLDRAACPTCNEPIEREQEVGSYVFAVPCGHRLGRSRAA